MGLFRLSFYCSTQFPWIRNSTPPGGLGVYGSGNSDTNQLQRHYPFAARDCYCWPDCGGELRRGLDASPVEWTKKRLTLTSYSGAKLPEKRRFGFLGHGIKPEESYVRRV